MSDTPKLADECKKLLDNGWQIRLFKNQLGSYTGVAKDVKNAKRGWSNNVVITDDFEPSQVLYRLTEKVFGNIV